MSCQPPTTVHSISVMIEFKAVRPVAQRSGIALSSTDTNDETHPRWHFGGSKTAMRIDVHNHAMPETVIELIQKDAARGVNISRGSLSNKQITHDFPKAMYEPAAKIAQLDQAGLDAAVVCSVGSLFGYETDPDAADALADAYNRGLSDYCQVYPKRLRWMAHVSLQWPAQAIAVIKRAVEAGAVGVKIATSVGNRRPDEPEFEPFWSAVEEMRLPVFVHPSHHSSYPGFEDYFLQFVIGIPLETTIFAERMICSGTLDRHPGLRLVLAHGAGFYPYQAGRLRHAVTVRPELKDSPRDPWLYVGRQIFADTITHDRQALQYLVSRLGSESVVMGTDHPYEMASQHPMEALRAAVDESTCKAIAEDNPSRLFPFA